MSLFQHLHVLTVLLRKPQMLLELLLFGREFL